MKTFFLYFVFCCKINMLKPIIIKMSASLILLHYKSSQTGHTEYIMIYEYNVRWPVHFYEIDVLKSVFQLFLL